MKKYLIALLACPVLFFACKEVGPNITPPRFSDTTYVVSPVPPADPHNVLVEEFTGQSCPNCPAAHDLLVGLSDSGQLNVIGLYSPGITQANPPVGHKYDFRTVVAKDIANDIYGGAPFSGIPCGGVDRVPVSGVQALYASSWHSAYDARKAVSDSVNIAVSSSYNAADTTAQIIVKVTYLYNMATLQNLSVAITEDSIVDLQENTTGIDSGYLFTYVLRDFVSAEPYGDAVLPDSVAKVPGRVSQLIYDYKLPASSWNPAHCHVIAFVANLAPNAEILQSASTKLTGP